MDMENLLQEYPLLKRIRKAEEIVWLNPEKTSFEESKKNSELTMADIEDAEARLLRFAPFIMKCFPETKDRGGLIESELQEIPLMKNCINRKYNSKLSGKLLLKKSI